MMDFVCSVSGLEPPINKHVFDFVFLKLISQGPGPPDSQALSTRYFWSWAMACVSVSFCSSSGVSLGRSMESVSLLSLPVKWNGTW